MQYANERPKCSLEKSKKISKNTLRQVKWKHNDPKSTAHNKSTSKKDVYSYISLLQRTIKISNKKKTNITPKTTKERKTNPKLIEGKKSKRSEQK